MGFGKQWERDGWRVEIEHDKFSLDEPYVVSLFVRDVDEEEQSEALATPSPTEARAMADALRAYADMADAANAKLESA